jgi:hypothetical protein
VLEPRFDRQHIPQGGRRARCPRLVQLGLRGTGSHDYAVCELFVPRARAIPFDAAPRAPGPLYRPPRQALLDNTMAALPLGIARTAIDTLERRT